LESGKRPMKKDGGKKRKEWDPYVAGKTRTTGTSYHLCYLRPAGRQKKRYFLGNENQAQLAKGREGKKEVRYFERRREKKELWRIQHQSERIAFSNDLTTRLRRGNTGGG